MSPRMVFVHGIGGPRDPARELAQWTGALANGMRLAGHSALAEALTADGGPVAARFAYYGDLFQAPQAQGDGSPEITGQAEEILADLLIEMVDALGEEYDFPAGGVEGRMLAHARAQARPEGQPQGIGDLARRALNVITTLMDLPPWRTAGRMLAPRAMVRELSQVARYLARQEPDEHGDTLDVRIRGRIAEALAEPATVVVAHSLGTVVALESLHEHHGEVPLIVTLGSPLCMRTVVHPRLVPQPPATPTVVGRWLNFWDRDDVIAVRPRLEAGFRPNARGVRPVSSRVDSDGAWVHPAVKYLAQPGVAGLVAEALGSGSAPGA
ncbi:hypothetical protein AW27_032360 [Streptomyces sp. PCS3-D2]|uniref:hypothetical protein n=1 Tax=Streptomyces sp. PCS3-D2 TaxID=1460244 RepID=UPI00044579C0|nr:hypothetical protein [Streptomyces sp. PCS3-D2]WKV75809.1 hypothetical protein AW27_032360 [Streptomyces sp. PCS3-D2]